MSSTCRKLAINDQLKVKIRQALTFRDLFLTSYQLEAVVY